MAWLLTWLVHGLAIALVTRFALRALPGVSAATRYAVWWAALVLVLLLPVVRGIAAGSEPGVHLSAAPVASSVSVQGDAGGPTGVGARAGEAAALVVAPAPSGLSQSFSLPPISLPRVPDWFLSIVLGLWLGSVMVGFAQLAYSVQAVRRLKTSCRRMVTPHEADLPMWSAVRDGGRAVRVCTSDRVRTAAVLGLTRPVIAVPRDAAAALTAHEIDQIVLHEYAHVQRYDDWTKLLQVLIAAFAGWHPAVRLMMREIDFEREAACDDYVVDVTGAPRAYARCLTKVIEMMPGSTLDLAAVPHAFSSASHATTRIERLLDRKRPSGRLAVIPAMAGSATLAVLAFCTVHALPIATDLPRGNESTAMPAMPRGPELRIAAASTLPIKLPFSTLSPMSRLTTAQPKSPRVTPKPAYVMPVSLPGETSVVASTPSTPTAPPPPRDASVARPIGARVKVEKPLEQDTPPRRAEATFALGPVVAAGDSDAMPEASDAGHIERAWESTRDATSKAVGASARAVGSATRTAGDATKSATKAATNKAAAGVKAGGTHTARAFGRVKRTLASVF